MWDGMGGGDMTGYLPYTNGFLKNCMAFFTNLLDIIIINEYNTPDFYK